MTVPHPSLAEAHELTRRLLAVAERARQDFSEVVAEFQLSPVQARTLLWLEEPSAMSDLAQHLSCDASNVTGIADRLTQRGLVERTAASDRRVRLLTLTPRGASVRAVLAERVAAGSTVSARLTRAERDQLAHLLGKLLGHDDQKSEK